MKQLAFLIATVFIIIGGCKVQEKIVDGQTAFERKQYSKAVKLLTEEYNKSKMTTERGKKAFYIAESYRIINEVEKAKDWYLKSYDAAYGADALKGYAYTLKQLENYKEAIAQFKELGVEIGDKYKYQREIVACRQSASWAKDKDKSEYEIELLSFNSKAADYYPVAFKDDQIIITSDRKTSTGDETYQWTGNNYSDLFIVDLKNDRISNFSETINSPYNEGTITFNKDFTEAFFSRCGDGSKDEIQNCKLMRSEFINNAWSKPEILNIVEDGINYSHPALSNDGKRLYFSTDDPDGLGGFDIYETKRTSEGWSDPQNLGTSINTVGNEVSPFIDKDTFYFASDHHIGMGGLDIFKTTRISTNRFGPLQNLRAPINSGADDLGFVVDYRKVENDPRVIHTGYFTSSRSDGKGNDDIYKFTKMLPPPPVVVPIDTTAEPVVVVEEPKIEYKLLLTGKVVEKVFLNPEDPNSRITGKTAIPTANVQVNFRDTTFSVVTDEKGEFEIELEEQEAYWFTGTKQDYLSKDANFSTRGIENDPKNPIQRFRIEIELDKVYKGVDIVLEGIYYDLDKADIRPDARPVLNRLANILLRNPSIRIELGSHTDCQGSPSYNQNLSQRRAQSAVDYLIKKGISADRMTAQGYGENQLLTDCACSRCSDSENQLNRRTAFKILE
jgi:outer membrane protein OmpA-like peptidoglycan-associated protein/tetratricopeptide (TPR) repeat protein